MSCVSAESLQRFVDGALAPDRFAEVESHIEGCAACRELLAAAAQALEGTAPSEPEEEEPPRGQIGRYQLEQPIGAGGMGVVYAATDPQLQRRVAIKILHRANSQAAIAPGVENSSDAAQRASLLREARAMAQLSHPHVLPVFEVGESDGRIFLVMELAEGGSLRDWLEKQARPPSEILELFASAGSGLEAAHKAGLVHRDFKPANVLLGQGQRALVTDFGLARELRQPLQTPVALEEKQESDKDYKNQEKYKDRERAQSSKDPHALQSSAAGSPGYMAPEQLRGEPVGPRADIFSFSVALYEALYRQRPFAGRSAVELLINISKNQLREPPPDSKMSHSLYRLLARGLRADPSERFSSMDELLSALASARHAARRRTLGISAAIAIAAFALLALLFISQNRKIARLAEEKARLDGSIAQVLQELDKEQDPARLAALDGQLAALARSAESDSSELAKSARRGLAQLPNAAIDASKSGKAAPGADELDLQLRALLSRFGAETYAVPPLFKERLRAHIEHLLAKPSLAEQWSRKKIYWPKLVAPLRALGLPEEMAYLAWTESGFDPNAKSPSGAVGMWQFTDFTARRFGLVVNGAIDERLDEGKSSDAAAHYLAELLAEFGSDSFLLGIASYNMGESAMRRALSAVSREPGGFRDNRDFWHLYLRKLMPEETREYVFSFLAAAIVGTNAHRYGLE